MDKKIPESLRSEAQWRRILFMLLFAFAIWLCGFILFLTAAVLAVFSLITGEPNCHLKRFGSSLSCYYYQLVLYLTFNSEVKPFPFAPWPSPEEERLE